MHRLLFAGCFGDCEPTSVEDANVRYGSLADIIQRIRNVRFTLNSGHAPPDHQCPLSAISRTGFTTRLGQAGNEPAWCIRRSREGLCAR
jgi:hypothetical protein